MRSHLKAGQFNLRGKRSKLLRCKCCEVVDLKTPYLKRLAIREAKEAANDGRLSVDRPRVLAENERGEEL